MATAQNNDSKVKTLNLSHVQDLWIDEFTANLNTPNEKTRQACASDLGSDVTERERKRERKGR